MTTLDPAMASFKETLMSAVSKAVDDVLSEYRFLGDDFWTDEEDDDRSDEKLSLFELADEVGVDLGELVDRIERHPES